MVATRRPRFNLDGPGNAGTSANRAILLGLFWNHAGASPETWSGPTKRGLCQSVCLSAICRTPRTRQICGNTCRASAHLPRSFFLSTGKRVGRADSLSLITWIAASRKKPSGDSISSHSRDVRWRSARRVRARTVHRGQGPAATVVHARAAVLLRRDSADLDPAAFHLVLQIQRLEAGAVGLEAGTSGPMRHQKANGSHSAKMKAVRADRSRSALSAGSTRTTRTGAPRARSRISTTSRRARLATTSMTSISPRQIRTTTSSSTRQSPAFRGA
jgi:hypothetical protein